MTGLSHIGLNERQVRLLRAIEPKEGSFPSQLALALQVPLPFVSRASKRMVGLGLIRRTHDSKDNRMVRLRRLAAGDHYLARLACLPPAPEPSAEDGEAEPACA